MMEQDLLNRLDQADWEILFLHLVAYAVTKTSNLSFMKGGGPLPQGHEPEDLAYEAVTLVYEGTRRWNPDEESNLLRYLTSVVDSLMSNLLRSSEHYHKANVEVDDLEQPLPITAPNPSPLSEVLAAECAEMFERICMDAADDEDLREIRMGLEDGMKSAEIAEFFSKPIKKVYNLTRKLRRRIREAMKRHPCWEDDPAYEPYLSSS